MPTPFETIVVPGYVVSLDYREGTPPKEICSPSHTYHEGYVEMTITVTKDNISIRERIETVFFLAPTEFESHDIVRNERGQTFPLVCGEKISNITFEGSLTDITGEPKDCDVITVIVNDDGPTDYNAAYIFFVHDKEDVFERLAVHE